MEQIVIIVAGGKGTRMKSELPKQFIEINGESIIGRTIKQFIAYHSSIQIIVVVHPDYKSQLEQLLHESDIHHPSLIITEGGPTRFDSVKNGLKLVNNLNAIVGIHDAARPFVSIQTIQRCFETAALKGNAIPCIPIHESMREVDELTNKIANRDRYKIIQTPQCFVAEKIKKAFQRHYQDSFTDDASVLETTGININLVEGNVENIKITSPFDLLIANALCKNE